MQELKMIWDDAKGKFANGKILLVGKWNVGNVYYDGCRKREDPLKYVVRTQLPGLKDPLGYFATEEEGKAHLEKVVRYWVKKLIGEI